MMYDNDVSMFEPHIIMAFMTRSHIWSLLCAGRKHPNAIPTTIRGTVNKRME